MSTPLLSICIPTYNRCEVLKMALQSLVSDAAFGASDEIEIIISDNHSTDQTEAVAMAFVTAYPGRIFYHCNESNIGAEANYERALSHGRGEFLRLHNDYLFTRPGSFTEILKIVRTVQQEKPVVFLTNGNRPGRPILEICENFDQFLQSVSYYATWIAGFGIWREQFQKIQNFSAQAHTKLVQVDVLFRLLATGCRSVVLNDTYFTILHPGKKSGHNVAEVFGRNFVLYLKHYQAQGLISQSTVDHVKREVLEQYILKNYFETANDFEKKDFFGHMREYRDDDYFYRAVEDFIFENLRS